MPITPAKKCLFCGIPIFGNHVKYCPDCSKFAFRIMNTRLSPEAIKGVRDYLHERGVVLCRIGVEVEGLISEPGRMVRKFLHLNPSDGIFISEPL
jgi:hypothetical protein